MDERAKGCLTSIFLVVAMLALLATTQTFYKITDERARPHITRLVQTESFTILDKSNNALVVGTPGDVTYNILLPDSTVVSCRCTDGLWQPLICRKYE